MNQNALSIQPVETGSELNLYNARPLSPETIKEQVSHIQKVMESVMKVGTHFGTIPGTNKHSLWKPGAEKLLLTFGVSVEIEIEDKSTDLATSYRVRATATHRQSGTILGSAYGEASTAEEKYKWRASVCDEEYEETPDSRRRIKYQRRSQSINKIKQIRTQKEDLANTVLKMAEKRALIGIAIRVTACGDIFDQSDYEDSNGSSNAMDHPKDVSLPKPNATGGCNHDMTEKVRAFSLSKHGSALCMDCQKQVKS